MVHFHLCALILYIFANINFIACDSPANLPSYVERCRLSDPKINECLLRNTELLKPYLAKGIPELDLAPMDPLIIPQVTLKQGTNALNFQAELNNIMVEGLSSYKFSKFDFDVPNLQWFIEAKINQIKVKGDYKASGRILLAPFQGEGKFKANISSADFIGYQKVKKIQRDGEEYVFPIITNTTINVAQPKVTIDGLLGDHPEINDVINRVINENVDYLFEDFRPVMEETIVQLFEGALLNSFENKVPFNRLYIDN